MMTFGRKTVLFICFLSAAFFPFTAFCWTENDDKSVDAVKEGADKEKAGNFDDAADKYMAANLYADDPVLKSNAVAAAARAYRKDKKYEKEFECLEKLLAEHIDKVNFEKIVNREYEIADIFADGHRDTFVEWLPFIHGADKTIEFYEKAIKNAPFSPRAPSAKLRLAEIYLEKDMPEPALEKFKDVVEKHPDTQAARMAQLGIANTYCHLASRGDGDGTWTALAIEALTDFITKYPTDPEVDWAKKSLAAVHKTNAKRLHDMGKFYHRIGRDETAKKYLSKVVMDYAENEESALPSEELLAEIDKTYVPPENPRRKKEEPVKFERSTIPLEEGRIIAVPETSDGKWLLPVRSVKDDIRYDSREKIPERPFNDDDI